jgi:hypothetical protein
MSEQLCPWHSCRQPPLIIMESPIKVGHTNASDARNKITHRPMRPKPLIPILIDMVGGVDIDMKLWISLRPYDMMSQSRRAAAAIFFPHNLSLSTTKSFAMGLANALTWSTSSSGESSGEGGKKKYDLSSKYGNPTRKFSPLAKANLFILSLEKQRTTD